MARDLFPPDLAAIDIGEVDDRRTISTNHAPATNRFNDKPFKPSDCDGPVGTCTECEWCGNGASRSAKPRLARQFDYMLCG